MPAAFACFPGRKQSGPEGVARDMIRISTIFIAICMVLVAASLGLVLYSVAGHQRLGIRDRGAHRADLPDPLQRRVDAAARPHRCRRPDRRSVARHRRPRPPGRRIRPPPRRRRGPGGVGEFRPAPTASRPCSARSTNSACWSSNSRSRSPATTTCWPRAPPPRRLSRRARRMREPPGELPDRRRSDGQRAAPARRRRRLRLPQPAPAVAEAAPRAASAQLLAAVKSAVEENRHRHLSAADGDAAAAQGALLRGGDAAARRQGPDSRRRRFHRASPKPAG